jgi:hypothetical protein
MFVVIVFVTMTQAPTCLSERLHFPAYLACSKRSR